MTPPESPPWGTLKMVIVPSGVDLATALCFVNQTFPSGPGVMAMGPMREEGIIKRPKFVPAVVRLPSAGGEVLWCTNQILPSGPEQIAPGSLGVGIANSVNVMSGPFTGIAGEAPPLPVVVLPVPVAVVVPSRPLTLPVVVAPADPPSPPAPDVVALARGESTGSSPSEHAIHGAAPAKEANAASERRFKRGLLD